MRLFPTGPGFVSVSETLVAGVSCSCLLIATQAAQGASALFRYNETHSKDQKNLERCAAMLLYCQSQSKGLTYTIIECRDACMAFLISVLLANASNENRAMSREHSSQ